jgi:hypothetical protein
MNVQRIVHAFAGTLVLLGVALSQLYSTWFLLIPVFVGFNLLQSAFTRFCPMAIILRRAGVPDPCPVEARPF